jgi:MFS family permease
MQTETTFKTADPSSGWAGEKPAPRQIAAILLLGIAGMLICGVQPVLLGAMVREGRLSTAGVGWTTTAEFLALGIGMLIAGTLFKPRNLRVVALAAALVMGAANVAMLYENGDTILLNRVIAGCGEATLVWITSCMIARSATPARWSGLLLALQGITQLAFAAIVPLTLMPIYGANGGFLGMVGVALLAGSTAFFLPRQMADLPSTTHSSLRIFASIPSMMHLMCVFLISAFAIGLFAYLGPLSIQSGLRPHQFGFVVAILLGSAVLGSSSAVVISRLPYYPLFIACLCINGVILGILWTLPDFTTFLILAVCFGFSWLFFMPYQMPMAIRVDPTRRVAVVLTSAQFFGGAAGPLICSFFVTDVDVRGALLAAGACFFAAFVISTLLHLRFGRANAS